ncbi:hypothetical protein N7447_005136 [Penicillium robsamsonii]|uniref:uncharacterized protein n=1 Tax=Penicillium robsamsonii TaxID=1792511 RepID=UPI002547D523|nr:uncharacterized protein N7447_005136 [Penicillium robsamsonii]KAJ5822796.1 hypothetical protein N7447_005136 [Penicillium robsamsonii]
MASLKTEGSTGPDLSLPGPVSRTTSSSSIMANLPDGYVVHHFSCFELLRAPSRLANPHH